MKFIAFSCGLLLALLPVAAAQTQAQKESPGLTNTVILIIRHAEKPDSGNGLSPAGKQRAKAYVNYFKNFQVDSQPLKLDYLFATNDSKESHRPRLTLEPVGKALGLRIDDRFKEKQSSELARELQSKPPGKHILICWHHGEIPQLVRALGADPDQLLPHAKWPDDVFGWVVQLRYDADGRLISAETKRILENLMPGDADQPARSAP
jgi:hypothetical protein